MACEDDSLGARQLFVEAQGLVAEEVVDLVEEDDAKIDAIIVGGRAGHISAASTE